MDPITILGAASSAVGIASFGIQLAQVLSKFISDVGSAGQTLHAILESIKSASATMKHINGFLEEEGRNLKKGNKPALFSSEAITDIQTTTDQCLKIFWRVEAWVISRDDSVELEAKLTVRLDQFKTQLKVSKDSEVPILNLDKSLAKARKLSKRDRLQWPFSAPKLEQYNDQLHRLEAHLTLMFQVITVCALQRKPGIGHAEINSIYEIYAVIPQTAAESEIAGIKLEVSGRRRLGRFNSMKIADDDTKSRLSSRFAPTDLRSNDSEYDNRSRHGKQFQFTPLPGNSSTTRRGRGPQVSTDSYETPSVGMRANKTSRATSRRYSNAMDGESALQDDYVAIESILSSAAKTNAALKHIADETAKAKKTLEAEISSNGINGKIFQAKFPESHLGMDTPPDTENLSMLAQRSTKSVATGDGRNAEHIESYLKPNYGTLDDRNILDTHAPVFHRDQVDKSTSTEEPFSNISLKPHASAISLHQSFGKDSLFQPEVGAHDPEQKDNNIGTVPTNDKSSNKHVHITLSPAPAHHRINTHTERPTNTPGEELINASSEQNSTVQNLDPCANTGRERSTTVISPNPSSFASRDVSSPTVKLRIKNGIRRFFQQDHFTAEDMEQMFSTGCFVTAFLIKGKQYHQIPSPGHFRLRKAQLNAIISRGSGPTWWQDFCFLDADEISSINEILKPRKGFRKTIVQLKQMRKIRLFLWWYSKKALVVTIINEPSGQLDLLLETSQATMLDSSINIEHQVETPIAEESRINLEYAVYSVHPRTGDDWLWAHITPQLFAKTEVIRRIQELNHRGESVIVKKTALQRLQQEQIGIIINAKNESDTSFAWSLAQLDVLYQDSTPTSGGQDIRAITVYLVGEPRLGTPSDITHEQSEDSNIKHKRNQSVDAAIPHEPVVTFAETDSQIHNRKRKGEERYSIEKETRSRRADRESKTAPSTPLFGNSNTTSSSGNLTTNLFGNPNTSFGNSDVNTGLISNPPVNSWMPYNGTQPHSQYSFGNYGLSHPYGYPQYPVPGQQPQGYMPNMFGAPSRVTSNSVYEPNYPPVTSYHNPLAPMPYYNSQWAAPVARPPAPSILTSETSSPEQIYAEVDRQSRVPYPEYYDGRSFDPRTPDYEDGKDIVRQLLLKWTPAGDEHNEEAKSDDEQNEDGYTSQSSVEPKKTVEFEDVPWAASLQEAEARIEKLSAAQARKKLRLAATVESDDETPIIPVYTIPREPQSRSMVSGWSYAEPENDLKKRKRKGKQVNVESEPEPELEPAPAVVDDDLWGNWGASKKTKKKNGKTGELQGFDIPDAGNVNQEKDLAADADDDWGWGKSKSKKDTKMKKRASTGNMDDGNQQKNVNVEPIADEGKLHGAASPDMGNKKEESAKHEAHAEPRSLDPDQKNIFNPAIPATNAIEKETITTNSELPTLPLPEQVGDTSGLIASLPEKNSQAQSKKRVRLMAEPMYMEDTNEGSDKPLLGSRRSATTTF